MVNESGRFAVIRPNNIVESIVVWDGVSEWNPCHDDDRVIFCDEVYAGPGFTYNDDGTFTAPPGPTE